MGVAYAFLSFVYGGKWGEGELSGSGGGWVRTTAVVDKWTAVDVRIFLSDVRVFPFAYRTEKQYKKGRDMNVRVRVMFLFFVWLGNGEMSPRRLLMNLMEKRNSGPAKY